MYTKLCKPFLAVLCLFAPQQIFAQRPGDARFDDYLVTMPFVSSTMDLTLRSMGNNPDATLSAALVVPNAQRTMILQSFFDRFREDMAGVAPGKYDAVEQKMMQRFRQASNGVDAEGQLAIFSLLMEERPLLAAAKLSWTRIAAPLSARGKNYYQQLLNVEQLINWPVFFKEAAERSLLQRVSSADTEIEAIDQQMLAEQAKVPLKKIKVFENSDVISEVPDPVQLVKVLKAADDKRQLLYMQRHNDYYRWWKVNEVLLRQCAYRLDALLEATGNGSNLAGADRQLIAMIADCQERIWHGVVALNGVVTMTVTNARAAAGSKQMAEETLETYRKMEGAGVPDTK